MRTEPVRRREFRRLPRKITKVAAWTTGFSTETRAQFRGAYSCVDGLAELRVARFGRIGTAPRSSLHRRLRSGGRCLDFENQITKRAAGSIGLYAVRNISGFSTAKGSVGYGEYQNYTGNIIRYVELQYDDVVDLIAIEQTGKVGETQVRLSSATVSRELTEAEAKVWTT